MNKNPPENLPHPADMKSSLRDRIAAVLFQRRGYSHGWDDETDECREMFRCDADAVIAALNLAKACEGGCVWQIPNRYEDMTVEQRELLERGKR